MAAASAGMKVKGTQQGSSTQWRGEQESRFEEILADSDQQKGSVSNPHCPPPSLPVDGPFLVHYHSH